MSADDLIEYLAPGTYAVAEDGDRAPSLWRGGPDGLPMQVVRRCDLATDQRVAWDDLVHAMTAPTGAVAGEPSHEGPRPVDHDSDGGRDSREPVAKEEGR